MARVIGLDLGSYSVKAIAFEGGGRTPVQLTFADERRAPEGEKRETLQAAVRAVLAKLPPAEQVVVSLPDPSLSTHAVSLPFTDPKRIEATVPFEVESQLPFDLADVAFDYQPVGQSDPKKSDLLVGVLRKTELSELLAELNEVGVDPRVVMHPAIALGALFAALPAGDGTSAAVLEIGHERSSLAIGVPGGPLEFARTFAGGGKDLSRALAQEFQISFVEANHWKEAHGGLGAHAQGPDGERAAAAFVRGLNGIYRELRPSLKAFSARTHRPVGRIFLAGGSSLLPGLAEQLSRDLGVPVEPFPTPAGLDGDGPRVAARAIEPYALGLRGTTNGPKALRFNFRRGEFAFKGHFDYLRERIGLLAAYAATVLILLIGFGLVRNAVLSQQEHAVDQELCKVTQRVLGTCEKNFDRALNMLRGEKSPAAALPQVSAVNLLAELTTRIPADANVTLDQVVIDPDRVSLRGQTDNSKQIDRIQAALKGYRCFKDVKEGKVERSKDGSHVVFRFDIQVECPGQAPAAEAG